MHQETFHRFTIFNMLNDYWLLTVTFSWTHSSVDLFTGRSSRTGGSVVCEVTPGPFVWETESLTPARTKSEETNDSALFGIFQSLSCDLIPADEVTWPDRVQSVAVEMLSWLSVYIYSDTICQFKNTVDLKTPRGDKQTRTRPEYQRRTSDTEAESWRFLRIGQLRISTGIPQFSDCPSIWQGSKYGSSDWTNRPTKTPTRVFTC